MCLNKVPLSLPTLLEDTALFSFEACVKVRVVESLHIPKLNVIARRLHVRRWYMVPRTLFERVETPKKQLNKTK